MRTIDLDETREAWDAIAPGYDEFVTEPSFPLAERALRLAGIREGARVLDVACGPGAVSIPAARLSASVLAVDLAPKMISRVTARARNEGLTNLEARVMDGHALELPDDAFDIAISQFGVMLFPDLPRALSEMARVTRSDGRVVLTAYGPQPDEVAGFFLGAIHAAVPDFEGIPDDPPPLPFQVSDPDVLRQRLVDAGLRDVRIESGAEELHVRSGVELWNWVVNSNPIAVMLTADLTDAQRETIQRVLDGMIRERSAGNGPAVITNPVNIGLGTK